jgi:hypothetical protein
LTASVQAAEEAESSQAAEEVTEFKADEEVSSPPVVPTPETKVADIPNDIPVIPTPGDIPTIPTPGEESEAPSFSRMSTMESIPSEVVTPGNDNFLQTVHKPVDNEPQEEVVVQTPEEAKELVDKLVKGLEGAEESESVADAVDPSKEVEPVADVPEKEVEETKEAATPPTETKLEPEIIEPVATEAESVEPGAANIDLVEEEIHQPAVADTPEPAKDTTLLPEVTTEAEPEATITDVKPNRLEPNKGLFLPPPGQLGVQEEPAIATTGEKQVLPAIEIKDEVEPSPSAGKEVYEASETGDTEFATPPASAIGDAAPPVFDDEPTTQYGKPVSPLEQTLKEPEYVPFIAEAQPPTPKEEEVPVSQDNLQQFVFPSAPSLESDSNAHLGLAPETSKFEPQASPR